MNRSTALFALPLLFFVAGKASALEFAVRCDACTTDQQFLQAVPLHPNETDTYVYSLNSGVVRAYAIDYGPEPDHHHIDPSTAPAQTQQLVRDASALYLANGHSLHFAFNVPLPTSVVADSSSVPGAINLPANLTGNAATSDAGVPLPASATDYLEGHNVGGFNLPVLGHMPFYAGISLHSFGIELNAIPTGAGASVNADINSATSVQATVTWPDHSYCSVTVAGLIVAHIPGECYDSHGNRIPETASQVAQPGGGPTTYTFSGTGYPGDIGDWLARMRAWGIPITSWGGDFCSGIGETCMPKSELAFQCIFPD